MNRVKRHDDGPRLNKVDAAIASVNLALQSISSLTEEQEAALEAYSPQKRNGKDVALLLTGFRNCDRQMVHPITCQVFFLKCLPFFKQFPRKSSK